MNKYTIKQRRQQRIHDLMEAKPIVSLPQAMDTQSTFPPISSWYHAADEERCEPDPEWLWKNKNKPLHRSEASFFHSFTKRALLSILVFGAVVGVLKWGGDWCLPARTFVLDALHQDMDFQAVNVWYETHFRGEASLLPLFEQNKPLPITKKDASLFSAPVKGTVVQPYAITGNGIEIAPYFTNTNRADVQSIDAGKVVDMGLNPDDKTWTVIIQHTKGIKCVYAKMHSTHLKINDWVESRDRVGYLLGKAIDRPKPFYFAIKKENKYVDPAEVVLLD